MLSWTPACVTLLGFLHVFKEKPEAAVAVLHNEVLPFCSEKGLRVESVLTDNGRKFRGSDRHPYQIYLELNDTERRTKDEATADERVRGAVQPDRIGHVL